MSAIIAPTSAGVRLHARTSLRRRAQTICCAEGQDGKSSQKKSRLLGMLGPNSGKHGKKNSQQDKKADQHADWYVICPNWSGAGSTIRCTMPIQYSIYEHVHWRQHMHATLDCPHLAPAAGMFCCQLSKLSDLTGACESCSRRVPLCYPCANGRYTCNMQDAGLAQMGTTCAIASSRAKAWTSRSTSVRRLAAWMIGRATSHGVSA